MNAVATMCCTKCGQTKPMDSYNIRKNRGQPYRQCRDCMAARRWYVKNPERQKELNKSWQERNPERIRAIWREMVDRRRKDPAYRLHGRVSNQIWCALRGRKNFRGAPELVGYSMDELRAHLERQFTKGMGWHNMPMWHIDHIIPLSSFEISGPDDPTIRQAWALSNLRPLWAEDNQRKGASRETLL